MASAILEKSLVGSKEVFRLKVKEIAERKGYNMSTLSRKANVDFKTVKAIFRNPHHDASLYILDRLSQALDVPIGDLIEQTED